MLDVHPPHAPTHTWRDFFIHIATIVVGLCIAVGLEQAVEGLHHRHQVAETRDALRLERDKNTADLIQWILMIRRERASMDNNLLVLDAIRQNPRTPQTELPGILTWHNSTNFLSDATWSTASPTVLALFPNDEILHDGLLYQHIRLINAAGLVYWQQLNDARLYTFRDADPTRMTPAQIDRTIELTSSCLEKLYLLGVTIQNLNDDFPDVAKGFTIDEVNAYWHRDEGEANPALAAPRAKTIQRIDAVGKLKDYMPQATDLPPR